MGFLKDFPLSSPEGSAKVPQGSAGFRKFFLFPNKACLRGPYLFVIELVAVARPPRFRGEGSENRFSEPKVPQGSARFP